MIDISWRHVGATAPAFAPLLPKTLEAISRWGIMPGDTMETDEYGPFYRIALADPKRAKAPVPEGTTWLLRPATLKLGAMKALQDAPDYAVSWDIEVAEVFGNVVNPGTRTGFHDELDYWSNTTLDFMVQLAWFREVWFA